MSKRALVLAGLTLAASLGGCDWGDWFPFERTARTLFNGWDMWDTAAVSPHQVPMPAVPPGTVPFGGLQGYTQARAELERMGAAARRAKAALAYRRYCHHCHGANGDGRIIVGESFTPAPPDLRAPDVQQLADDDLHGIVMEGGGKMIPLRGTLTPLEAQLAISHMRTLASAPSRPFLPPRDEAPINDAPAR